MRAKQNKDGVCLFLALELLCVCVLFVVVVVVWGFLCFFLL